MSDTKRVTGVDTDTHTACCHNMYIRPYPIRMHILTYVCTHRHTYIHKHTNTHTHSLSHTHTHTYTYTHTYTQTHKHIHTHTHRQTHTHTDIDTDTHVHMHTHTHAYTPGSPLVPVTRHRSAPWAAPSARPGNT